MLRNNKGFTSIMVLYLLLMIFIGIGWTANLFKLAQCDFEAPYKAEIIHGIGLIPVVGAITGWMDLGK